MNRGERGRLIVVCGAKGGVGTTAVSANLAAALALKADTAIVALSRREAEDLALWFGAGESGTTADFREIVSARAPELLAAAAEKSGSGPALLPLAAEEADLAFDELRVLFELALMRYRWVVTDWGVAGSGDGVLSRRLMEMASLILLVFNGDPMAIRRAREAGGRLAGAGSRLRALSNRAGRRGTILPAGGRWDQALGGLEVLAEISEAPEFEEAMLRGEPPPLFAGDSDAAEEFVRLAELADDFRGAESKYTVHKAGDPFDTSAYRQLKRRIHRRLLEQLGPVAEERGPGSGPGLREELERLAEEEGGPLLTPGFRRRLIKELTEDVTGFGPLQELLDDPEVTEIMVNGPEAIFVERGGALSRISRRLDGEEEARALIERIIAPLGRRIDASSPLVDARLPDGSRLNAVIPPLSLNGPCLTIRKFPQRRMSAHDLIACGSIDEPVAEFLRACVAARLNLLISGGTGSGKTTLLNVLAASIGPEERIVTIEDAAELKLGQEHVVRLETRPPGLEGGGSVTVRDLVRNALRMRPDRILVGECRGGEALDMLQAMNTGHEGSISTLHANGPRDALSRLETMVLMAGMELPLRAVREQISSALDLIVHLVRLKNGDRRVTEIVEIGGLREGSYQLGEVYTRRGEGRLTPRSLSPGIAERLAERGQTFPAGFSGGAKGGG